MRDLRKLVRDAMVTTKADIVHNPVLAHSCHWSWTTASFGHGLPSLPVQKLNSKETGSWQQSIT